MPVIGTFSAVKDGYAGNIRTLMLNGRVKILANDRKESEGAPDFRISLGTPGRFSAGICSRGRQRPSRARPLAGCAPPRSIRSGR